MLVTAASLDALRTGFRNDFNTGLAGYKPMWQQVATPVPSTTASNTYGWLKDFPRLRKWVGDRVVKSISEGSYSVENDDFEATVGVKRKAIEDDQLGIYAPMMQGLGRSAAEFPDELVFELLAAGFTTPCWDGQNFFDTEHPVGDDVVSNYQAGAGEPWMLLDTTRPLKPLIFQDRKKPEFVAMTKVDDEAVFMQGEFRYGVDMRCAAGFGFWQLAFGSKAPLTPENYEAQRTAMKSQTNDEGGKLNIRHNILAVGPSNEAAAKKIVKAETINGGESNPNYNDCEILVVPWLA